MVIHWEYVVLFDLAVGWWLLGAFSTWYVEERSIVVRAGVEKCFYVKMAQLHFVPLLVHCTPTPPGHNRDRTAINIGVWLAA